MISLEYMYKGFPKLADYYVKKYFSNNNLWYKVYVILGISLGEEPFSVYNSFIVNIYPNKMNMVHFLYGKNKCIIGVDTGNIKLQLQDTCTIEYAAKEMLTSIVNSPYSDWKWKDKLEKDNDYDAELDKLFNRKKTADEKVDVTPFIPYIINTKLCKSFYDILGKVKKDRSGYFCLKKDVLKDISGYRKFIPVIIIDFENSGVKYWESYDEDIKKSKTGDFPLENILDFSYEKNQKMNLPLGFCEYKSSLKEVIDSDTFLIYPSKIL